MHSVSLVDSVRTTADRFHTPAWLLARAVPPGTFNPASIREIGERIGWFDTLDLSDIALHGADLRANIPPGARPRGRLWTGGPEEEAYMQTIIDVDLKMGYIRPINRSEEAHYAFLPLMMRPKAPAADGKKRWRDVLNPAARMNLAAWGLPDISFNESTPLDNRPSVSPGRLDELCELLSYLVNIKGVHPNRLRGFKFDMRQGYKHVKLSDATTRLTAFRHGGTSYVQLRLIFGTAVSSATFCRFVDMLRELLRREGVGIVTYVDDTLGIAIGDDQADSAIALIKAVYRFAGVDINEEKSDSTGHPAVDYNGVTIDFAAMTLAIQAKTVANLLRDCDDLLSEAGESEDFTISSHELLDKLVGRMSYCSMVVRALRPVRAYFYSLKRYMRRPRRTERLRHYISIVRDALLGADSTTPIVHAPHQLARQHDMELSSDASDDYIAGCGFDKTGNLVYFQERRADLACLSSGEHINHAELLAHIALVEVVSPIVGPGYRVIPTKCDNTSAISWVRRLYSKATAHTDGTFERPGDVSQRLGYLHDYALLQSRRHINVTADYVTSEANVLADALTRPADKSDVLVALFARLRHQRLSARRIRLPHNWHPSRL